jgi:myo-inositol-1(or 4)-monophosphatase
LTPEGAPPLLRPEAVAAVDVVGEALRRAAAGTGAVHAKQGRDVVTDTDLGAEDLIRGALSDRFGWPVVGEERGGAIPAAGPYWLVDPICGTRNYASGIPLYAVNVALVEDGVVTTAAVGDGSTGMIAVAERDRGAWSVRPSRKRLRSDDASATVDLGAWPRSPATRAHAGRRAAALIEADLWDVRSFSTTLSLAYVAAGRLAGCILFRTPGVVHTAAGSLLVAEAGGTVTDIDGRAWTLASGPMLCGATPRLHQDLLRLMG